MMKNICYTLIFIAISLFAQAQSKQELRDQNNQLKRMYNELQVEKQNLEKQNRAIQVEKQRLAEESDRLEVLAKKLDKEYKKEKEQVEKSEAIIEEKSNEIKTKDVSISQLTQAKQISDLMAEQSRLMAEQSRLESENRKSTQKIMALGLALMVLIAGLLLYLFIARKKASVILEKEKKKSDSLLLNILPQQIADELKNTSKTSARSYDKATVMFADIKNFTKISATLSPALLIDELEYIFGAYDSIIQKYNIEKIKVIGDCYMCVGGIPESNDTNPVDVVAAALEIQKFMGEMKAQRLAEKKQVYEVRIGINTGPIVAGVIGSKKFAYDVWGDTVNLASRLEAASEPGRVNISQNTYEYVKSNFPCIHRGKIEAKGKGGVDMYFVTSASMMSESEERIPEAS